LSCSGCEGKGDGEVDDDDEVDDEVEVLRKRE
jgi:hypothetical protein